MNNEERPHSALGGATPASRYCPSARPYPERLPPLEYPGHFLMTRATNAGTILVKDRLLFLAKLSVTHRAGLLCHPSWLSRIVADGVAHSTPSSSRRRSSPTGTALRRGLSWPFEPRMIPDGSVLLNAYGCGFYRVTGVETASPRIANVHTIDARTPDRPNRIGGCGTPVVAGRFWVMAVGTRSALVTLDVSDPARPRARGPVPPLQPTLARPGRGVRSATRDG